MGPQIGSFFLVMSRPADGPRSCFYRSRSDVAAQSENLVPRVTAADPDAVLHQATLPALVLEFIRR